MSKTDSIKSIKRPEGAIVIRRKRGVQGYVGGVVLTCENEKERTKAARPVVSPYFIHTDTAGDRMCRRPGLQSERAVKNSF